MLQDSIVLLLSVFLSLDTSSRYIFPGYILRGEKLSVKSDSFSFPLKRGTGRVQQVGGWFSEFWGNLSSLCFLISGFIVVIIFHADAANLTTSFLLMLAIMC